MTRTMSLPFLLLAAAAPTVPSPPTPVPAEQVQQLIAVLADPDPAVGRRAAVLLRNCDGAAERVVADAVARPGTPRAAITVLRDVEPILRARAKRGTGVAARLAWMDRAFLRAYRGGGFSGPDWDAAVTAGLHDWLAIWLSGGGGGTTEALVALSPRLEAAARAGCDDPAFRYVADRVASFDPANDTGPLAADAAAALGRVFAGGYPTEVKLLLATEFARTIGRAKPDLGRGLHVGDRIRQWLPTVLAKASDATDPLPPRAAGEFAVNAREALGGTVAETDAAFAFVEPLYVAAYRGDVGPMVERARYGVWFATVPDRRPEDVSAKLADAAAAVERAWQLDPTDARAPAVMVRVNLLRGGARADMERWFGRAVAADPDRLEPYEAKRDWLLNRHDEAAALAFGRACAAAGNWRSAAPFVLATLHARLATESGDRAAYFRRPDVWADLRSVYEPYFALYPADRIQRNLYARCAYDAGRYAVAQEQFARLGDRPNFAVFGGDEAYVLARFQTARKLGLKPLPTELHQQDGFMWQLKVAADGTATADQYKVERDGR